MTSQRARERRVQWLATAVAAAAVLSAMAGLVPYEWLQPLGAYVRRPDDVTQERYARYRHVAWWFATTFALLAGWLWWRRMQVASFLQSLWTGSTDAAPTSLVARTPRSEWLLVLLILAVGVGLRLSQLNAPMAYDESYTYINLASRPWYEAIGDYNSTNNHLLNTLLVHLSTRLFGASEWAIRLPVFVAGCALPLAVWGWARRWRGPAVACGAAALTAVAPALISYSTDARGYMDVALAAVLLDWCCGCLRERKTARTWLGATLVTTLGLCAMPIMVYAAVASLGWYVCLPRGAVNVAEPANADDWGSRLRSALLLSGFVVLGVTLFYTPAYLFRGLQFLRDPIMQSASPTDYVAQQWQSWTAAARWWTDGPFPLWCWGAFAVVGAILWRGSRWGLARWGAPFVVVLALNLLQAVAPPPRIYLHLAPWICLLCATGVIGLLQFVAGRLGGEASSVTSPQRVSATLCGLVLIVLLAGGVEFLRRPVPFFPEERISYVSIPEAIARLQREVQARPEKQQILFAPLPCDLPSIFYMDRLGFRLPVDVRPAPGDRVWLLSRPGESIDDVLGSGLIQCADLADDFTPWERIAEFRYLTLSTAVLRLPTQPAPSPDE